MRRASISTDLARDSRLSTSPRLPRSAGTAARVAASYITPFAARSVARSAAITLSRAAAGSPGGEGNKLGRCLARSPAEAEQHAGTCSDKLSSGGLPHGPDRVAGGVPQPARRCESGDSRIAGSRELPCGPRQVGRAAPLGTEHGSRAREAATPHASSCPVPSWRTSSSTTAPCVA